jgi:hypothetical protein
MNVGLVMTALLCMGPGVNERPNASRNLFPCSFYLGCGTVGNRRTTTWVGRAHPPGGGISASHVRVKSGKHFRKGDTPAGIPLRFLAPWRLCERLFRKPQRKDAKAPRNARGSLSVRVDTLE